MDVRSERVVSDVGMGSEVSLRLLLRSGSLFSRSKKRDFCLILKIMNTSVYQKKILRNLERKGRNLNSLSFFFLDWLGWI